MKRKVIQFFVLLLAFAALLGVLQFIQFGGFTGFAIFSDTGQSDFDAGTYVNTSYNGTSVILTGTNTTGSFTSQVFDATDSATWNNLTYNGGEPGAESLYAVDRDADIFSSTDGVTWVLVKDDYNGGDGNSADYMVKNSSGSLFIMNGQDLWSSTDGVSWTKVNDDFNPGDGSSGQVIEVDSNDNIFIVDGSQETWKSTDSGLNFTSINDDFNGGNENAYGMSSNSSNSLFLVDTQADVWQSVDEGVTWTLVNDDYNAGNGNGASDMTINSTDDLFILDVQDLWASTDSGVTWTLVNDDYNGGSDSNAGQRIYVDSNDDIFIIDSSEDVFKSINSGTSFSLLVSNYNGANSNNVGLNGLNEASDLSFAVMNCSSSDCADGSWQDVTLASINLQSRYFRYRANFTTPSAGTSPYLVNVSIGYDLVNQAPSVSISNPTAGQLFTTNESLNLTYSASDADDNLDSCWYNVDGGSNATLTSCANTTFNVTGDGDYVLNLYANDTNGLGTSQSVSFSVDVTGVSVSISEPTGTKSSRTGITLDYTATGNNLTCIYNVETSIGGDIIANTTLTGCADTTFNVSTDGDFVANLYVNNTFGTSNSTSSSFSVDTSASYPPTESPGEGGGGGGGFIVTQNSTRKINLEFSGLGGIIMKKGTSETFDLEVTNKWMRFLNNCKLKGSGAIETWISNEQEKGLSGGEKFEYSFVINVPENVDIGVYSGEVLIECDEGQASHTFGLTVYRNIFEAEVIDYERTDTDLRVTYLIEEFGGLEHELALSYEFIDFDDVVRKSGVEGVVLGAGFSGEQVLEFELPKDSFGEFKLKLSFADDTGLEEFLTEVFLPSKGVTGFAISEENQRTLSIVGIIVLSLVFVFFISRFVWKRYRRTKGFLGLGIDKELIDLDFNIPKV